MVTKVTKTPQASQQWLAAELNPNDIIGVYESLGNKAGHNLTIESKGGPTIIRLNVCRKIYQYQNELNPCIPYGGSIKRPYLIDEVEEPRTDHFIDAGAIWQASDLSVLDVKVLQIAPQMVLTVY